jgi:hypothetical protein
MSRSKGFRQTKESNLRRSISCKKAWTKKMRKAQAKRMKKRWTKKFRNNHSKRMKKNNPMHDKKIRRRFRKIMKVKHATPEIRKRITAGIHKFWKSKKGKKLKIKKAEAFKSYFKNKKIFRKMQLGNKRRIGKPNVGAINYFKNLSFKDRRARSENLSNKLAGRFAGRPTNGSRFGKQGFVRTRFGIFRYDSSWERIFIFHAHDTTNVKKLDRDFPIKYFYNGSIHNFLVDFLLTFKSGEKWLIEIKCPFYLKSKSTKAKIKAAKKFAKDNNFKFVLLKSKRELEVLP